MPLNEYLQQAQRFLRDAKQEKVNADDLRSYVNRARREVAMRAECIRVLTPISGQIIGWTVTDPGSGYSAFPTLTVSAPDFPSGTGPFPNGDQATATAAIIGGTFSAVNSVYGGAGYFQPQMTITDPTGTGASVTPVMSFINQLEQGREVYPFSSVDLSQFPGVESIYFARSVSIIYANYRYSLPVYSFSTYQAMIRQYPFQYQYVPTFAAQFGQGTSGSLYMYPLPSQVYQYELDCSCLPQDLLTNNSVEAIPGPWTDAIPYFAAHLAYLELQNFNYAKGYFDLFDTMMNRYGSYARRGRVSNPYGRY
jgi:hypothetical protein